MKNIKDDATTKNGWQDQLSILPKFSNQPKSSGKDHKIKEWVVNQDADNEDPSSPSL